LDSLVERDTVTLVATAYDSVGGVLTGRAVTWSSSGTSIATVSAAGRVTAQDTGTAYVIATIESVRDSAEIVVSPVPVAGLVIGKKGYGVATADSVLVVATAFDASGIPIPDAAVAWTSRNSAIASVDSAGYVTGVVAGETDIIATSGGFTDSTHVLVGSCATTQTININHFLLPIEAGGQWNDSPVAPSGMYRTNGTMTNSGIAFGTDGSHLALGTNITGTWDTGDIALDPVCAYQTTAVNRTLVDLTVAPSVGLDSLDVVQETWAVPDQASPTASYILFRYTFTNESAQALTNFHAAYFADWDIAAMNGTALPGYNFVTYDATSGVGEATAEDTTKYPPVFGVVPVAASGAMNFKGWENGTGTLGDPQTDVDIFSYLSAGIDTTVPGAATDIRELMGVGPVTIPAGGRYVVYFGVLGAGDQTRFDQFVTMIRIAAQGKGF
ncbi:MAG TPA: Ig-like domain-containing protein, partial [Gemmatimonadales bacterium]|nr:Ig-like domain-containing protein [Gemmatimonadales bacterium]